LGGLQNFFSHSRWKETRRDRVDSNASPRPLRGKLAGHRDQSTLRRDVADYVLAAFHRAYQSGDRCYIDDVATAPFEHLAPGALRKEKRSRQIDLKHHVPFLERMLFDGLSPGDASVVDED